MNLTRDQARALWYVTATGGFTDQIAEANARSITDTHILLAELRLKQLTDYGLLGPNEFPRWYLTTQGLEEHERRMNASHAPR